MWSSETSLTRCSLALLSLVALVHLVAGASIGEPKGVQKDSDYWLRRKEWFRKRTTFELTESNLKLLGPRRLLYINKAAQPKGHLPFWFDYELFKAVFPREQTNKPTNETEDRARHNVYIKTCLRTLKARVLFRMLAGTSDTFITADADKVSWRKRDRKSVRNTLRPQCKPVTFPS